MNYIKCKAQWFSRPLKTKTSMAGFEGPALKTELDDGFGVPMMKGMLTPSYNCYFEQTGEEDHSPTYDGTINIPDTPANRYKIAMHVRSRDLRVVDRNLERVILAGADPNLKRNEVPRPRSLIVDMPEDFDGSQVVLRSSRMAIVDVDPIEDPFAAVSDGEFTEVKSETSHAPASEPDVPVKLVAPAVSVAAAREGMLPKQASEAPKGLDPRVLHDRAAAVKAEAANKAEATKE